MYAQVLCTHVMYSFEGLHTLSTNSYGETQTHTHYVNTLHLHTHIMQTLHTCMTHPHNANTSHTHGEMPPLLTRTKQGGSCRQWSH